MEPQTTPAKETVKDFVDSKSQSYKRIETAFVGIYGETEGKNRWQQESTFLRQMFTTNPKLLECTYNSVGMQLSKLAAQDNTLDPALQLCYLLPRWNKSINGNEAVLQGGFYNKVEKINEAGLQILKNELIYEGETYKIEKGVVVEHNIDLALRNQETMPKILAGYMLTELPNGGGTVCDIAYPKDVEYSKSFSQQKASALYKESISTAYYRICVTMRYKTLPKSPIRSPRADETLDNIFDKPSQTNE